MSELLSGYPLRLTLPVLWGDMDAYQHVNNTTYLRWFESARVAYFEKIGLDELKERLGVGGILSETYCRFKAPLSYPDEVDVGARVADVQDDRFAMAYVVASRKLGRVAAEGSGTIVCYDYRRGAKTALPDELRRRIEEAERA